MVKKKFLYLCYLISAAHLFASCQKTAPTPNPEPDRCPLYGLTTFEPRFNCCNDKGEQVRFDGDCSSITPDEPAVGDALAAGAIAAGTAQASLNEASKLEGIGTASQAGGVAPDDLAGLPEFSAATGNDSLINRGKNNSGNIANNQLLGSNDANSRKTAGNRGPSSSSGTSPNLGSGLSTSPTNDPNGGAGLNADGLATSAGDSGSIEASGKSSAQGTGNLGDFGRKNLALDSADFPSEAIQFNAAAEGAQFDPMAGPDPEDYFTRINLEDSLFKVVEKRYRSKSVFLSGLPFGNKPQQQTETQTR